jgi:hypothetical protein
MTKFGAYIVEITPLVNSEMSKAISKSKSERKN